MLRAGAKKDPVDPKGENQQGLPRNNTPIGDQPREFNVV